MAKRWDTDERGRGVGDAAHLAGETRKLLDAMSAPGWVAEDPEVHLLPHVERFCGRPDSPLALESHETRADATFAVTLRWRGEPGPWREPRAAVFALLGEIAELAVVAREHHDGTDLVLNVVTGMLAGDTAFAPHGHTLRLTVMGAHG